MKPSHPAHSRRSKAQPTPTLRHGSPLRSAFGYLLLLGSFAVAWGLSQIPALIRIDVWITRHAQPLIIACVIALGVAFPVFMGAVVVTMFNRGKPMTREDVERWERHQMSQGNPGNILRFNYVYGGSLLAGQRQFSFADVFANWRTGRGDPYWRTTYAMIIGGLTLVYGMLALWFLLGTLQMRVLSATLAIIVTVYLGSKVWQPPAAIRPPPVDLRSR